MTQNVKLVTQKTEMNERVRQLMLEAGYAAPELAGRANKLVDLVLTDVVDILAGYRGKVTWLNEEVCHNHPIFEIQKHFGVKK